jgi:hemoglobin
MRDVHRPTPSRDLDSPEEIAEMMRRFYADVAQDDLLGPMFNEVARVDRSEHLPELSAFWCRALLDQLGYVGNPFRATRGAREPSLHTRPFRALADAVPRNLQLGWAGPHAERAGQLADNVARVHRQHLIGQPVELDHTH